MEFKVSMPTDASTICNVSLEYLAMFSCTAAKNTINGERLWHQLCTMYRDAIPTMYGEGESLLADMYRTVCVSSPVFRDTHPSARKQQSDKTERRYHAQDNK